MTLRRGGPMVLRTGTHRSDAADWCATASSLASLAAYESGAPKIPEPEAPCDEDAGIADEVTEPVEPGAVLEHTSGPGSAEASSGNGNSSVTDSDWVASSKGDPPTTPSNPKVPPALGSATRPAAHRCCGRSPCSFSIWSPYSSRRKDANSPGLASSPTHARCQDSRNCGVGVERRRRTRAFRSPQSDRFHAAR